MNVNESNISYTNEGWNSNSAKPARDPEVLQQLKNIEGQISIIQEQVTLLSGRLSKVMSPEAPTRAKDGSRADGASCEIARILQANTNTLHDINDTLAHILQNLEI